MEHIISFWYVPLIHNYLIIELEKAKRSTIFNSFYDISIIITYFIFVLFSLRYICTIFNLSKKKKIVLLSLHTWSYYISLVQIFLIYKHISHQNMFTCVYGISFHKKFLLYEVFSSLEKILNYLSSFKFYIYTCKVLCIIFWFHLFTEGN